jgi:hypothetical protein
MMKYHEARREKKKTFQNHSEPTEKHYGKRSRILNISNSFSLKDKISQTNKAYNILKY